MIQAGAGLCKSHLVKDLMMSLVVGSHKWYSWQMGLFHGSWGFSFLVFGVNLINQNHQCNLGKQTFFGGLFWS